MIENKKINEYFNKFKGCLLGGAAGDALGYSVEFLSRESILKFHGDSGITAFSLVDGKAIFSDDTQMTLYTANGLICAYVRNATEPLYLQSIWRCYKDWHAAQEDEPVALPYAWLYNIPSLQARRAPGGTCLGALSGAHGGSIARPLNHSKGCGGVMRVAPVGLFFAGTDVPIENSDLLAAEVAALTHGHELGYIPAAALAHIVRRLVEGKTLAESIDESIAFMQKLFLNASHMEEFIAVMTLAIELSQSSIPSEQAIETLGEGWVAEETLAIAVYCALKFKNDFESALIASVNHDGDSDSTGAVTGNILGAYMGFDHIPDKFLDRLEAKDTIRTIAEDLLHCLEWKESSQNKAKYARYKK